MRSALGKPGLSQGRVEMKNRRNYRLVLECLILATAVVQLVEAIVNAVFNYIGRNASEVGSSIRAEARPVGV